MTKQCWTCTHRIVCKFWGAIADSRFPYAHDSKIRPLMQGMAETLAEACACYDALPEKPAK